MEAFLLIVKIVGFSLVVEWLARAAGRWVWSQWALRFHHQDNESFYQEVPKLLVFTILGFGWHSFAGLVLSLRKAKLVSDRGFDFLLSNAHLSSVIGTLLVTFLTYYLYISGGLYELKILQESSSGPAYSVLLLLADQSAVSVWAGLGIGYCSAAVLGISFFPLIVAVLGVAAFLFSVPVAACIVAGGWMGQYSHTGLWVSELQRKDLFHRFLTAFGAAILFIFLLPGLNEYSQILLGSSADPSARMLRLMGLIAVFWVLDSVVSSVFFHFRWISRQRALHS